ncbi:hypothetical protein ACFSTE_08450 [Aquimarina hainanensis]|uniref:DUF4136 domain-containing protein n=1 Tax=Aquimarina hainanensis TaxID=1578017 RepID=A0ABW5N6V0_9FLAO|nr:hypothetical protein [Aquimarina sp. TRL1]QKX03975.1 hypothetical protein HN014_03330 [Aquimarina sp. TRL1]
MLRLAGVSVIALLYCSCSSVDVTKTWNRSQTTDWKKENVVVVSKTTDTDIRKQFERDITTALNKEGYIALESYLVMPELSRLNNLDNREVVRIKNSLIRRGADILFLTVLRDRKEYKKAVKTTYETKSYPLFYRPFRSGDSVLYTKSTPEEVIKTIKRSFVLETLVYDLKEEKEKQLLSVMITEIDNPKQLTSVSREFSKEIVEALVSK